MTNVSAGFLSATVTAALCAVLASFGHAGLQRDVERLTKERDEALAALGPRAEAAPLTVIADNWTQEDYRNLQYAVDQAAWKYISFGDDATRARHEAFSMLKNKLEVAKEAAWRVEHGQQVGK